jgi:hypothetical protein
LRCSIINELNEINCEEKYHIVVSNRFAALEDLKTVVEINSAGGIYDIMK